MSSQPPEEAVVEADSLQMARLGEAVVDRLSATACDGPWRVTRRRVFRGGKQTASSRPCHRLSASRRGGEEADRETEPSGVFLL